ncbi:MAG: ribonuclease Y [Candidatus Sericytochromatia bacterium]
MNYIIDIAIVIIGFLLIYISNSNKNKELDNKLLEKEKDYQEKIKELDKKLDERKKELDIKLKEELLDLEQKKKDLDAKFEDKKNDFEERKKELDDKKKELDIKLKEELLELEQKKKQLTIEVKEELYKEKEELYKEKEKQEREIKEKEKRILQKEENIDKKLSKLETKELNLKKLEDDFTLKTEKLDDTLLKQNQELERISKMTSIEAKTELLNKIENGLKQEYVDKIKEYEDKIRNDSEKISRKILSQAIQRCAVDHVVESCVSVVSLPSDDMKGRIIGREGRNIRTFENLTGVELVIDDTPEAVVISGFDPVRREIARIALEYLVSDGRIHPTRIEEVIEKAKNEVEQKIKDAGEATVFELGIQNIHPEIIKTIGKLQYRTSYGQNILQHSKEVSHLAGIMAAELNVNIKLAKRAGLLHDLGKALTHEEEGTHTALGVELAKKYGETPKVLHAMACHHHDIEFETVEAVLVQVADALSAARPGARMEPVENYIKRMEKLEEISNSFEGVEKVYAMQAGREIRVMVHPDSVNDEYAAIIAKKIAERIESEMEYPGQVKITVIRETRATDYAK